MNKLIVSVFVLSLCLVTGWAQTPNYSRYGDFKSAQLRSTSTHGYGMYVAEMKMSYSPTVSTFWLYGDAPSGNYMIDLVQLHRWNEIDFEFVPYTKTPQAAYITLNGKPGTFTSTTNYGASLDLTSTLNQTGTDLTAVKSWVKGLVRTDEVVAKQTVSAAAINLSYTGGPPDSGTFKIAVVRGDTTVTSVPINYNATAIEVDSVLKHHMSNNKAFLSEILNSGFIINAASPAGATMKVMKDSTTITVPSSLIPQISPGDMVTAPGAPGTGVLDSGTTVIAIDRESNVVTISHAVNKNDSIPINFQRASAWSIVFNGGINIPSADMPDVRIELDSLKPAGNILGKVVPAFNSNQEATAFNISVFKSPLIPDSGKTWLELLAENTGPGKPYPLAKGWKYPLAMLTTPGTYPMDKMGSVNFWRVPPGDTTKNVKFNTYNNDSVYTRSGIYRGALPNAPGGEGYFLSQPLNNESFFWDSTGSYDPYSAIYAYVITWTPNRMAQYVLPILNRKHNGLPDINIDGVAPIVEYNLADYASLAQSGPSGMGADVPFAYTELKEKIGDVSINLANYVGYSQAGSGYNGTVSLDATVQAGSMIISNINSFTATANITKGSVDVTVTGIDSGSKIKEGMFITSETPKMIPAATYVSSIKSTNGDTTVITLSQPPSSSWSGKAYFFKYVVTSQNDTVSWVPQAGQSVSGKGIPVGSTIGSVSLGNSSITLKTPGNMPPDSAGTSITLETLAAKAGWSGPPPEQFLDSSAYVRSAGFFEWANSSDGDSTKDFTIALPDSTNDNFWVDFSDTRTWTADNWKRNITRYFNVGYTDNYTKLGAMPGKSLMYPNISLANVQLSSLNIQDTSLGVLALKVGANDLTLDSAGTNWKTPPNKDFFQISAVAPSGQVSATDPLYRVEVYKKGSPDSARTYWTANTPVLGSTYIYAPPQGTTDTVTVNLWVLDSGTLPKTGALPVPGHTATLKLTNTAADGPSFSVVADTDSIMATTSGRYITVKKPAN